MLAKTEPRTGWVLLHNLAANDVTAYQNLFAVALLQSVDAGMALCDADSGATLEYPPQPVLAVIHDGSAEKALFAWVQKAGLEAAIVTHTEDLPKLLSGFGAQLGGAARMNADLMLRMAELRTVHEEVLNAYNELRNFVCDNSLAPPQPGFLNLPETVGGATLPATVGEVVQVLPMDMRSLCGFALYLPAAVQASARGTLNVELLAAEDDEVMLSWQANYNKLAEGWITFAFEQSERFWRKTPVLRLSFGTQVGTPPRFALAAPQLRADKAAVIDGIRNTRTLAFKSWASVPGAPLAISDQMWPVIRSEAAGVTQIELDMGGMLDVRAIPGQVERSGFNLITLLPENQILQLHPFEGIESMARLPGACPAGTRRVLASVETTHAQAGRIEYALAIVPSLESEFITNETGLPAGVTVSDWVALPPLTPSRLQLLLAEQLGESADLFLLTRLSPGAASNYGWASFSRISFRGQYDL